MCFVVVVPVSTQGEVHFDTWINLGWTYTCLSFELSSLDTQTPCSARSFFTSAWTRKHFVSFEPVPFGAWGWTDAVYPYSLPLHSPSTLADPLTAYNLSHQSLFLHSRCFPMSAGPLTKQESKMENPPVLKCCTWVSLLSFPSLCLHQPSGSHGTLSRVQSWWWENIF